MCVSGMLSLQTDFVMSNISLSFVFQATYDDEIAFYKRHLESVYALCLSCEVTMKRELQRLDDTLGRQQDGLDQKIGAVGDNSSSLVEVSVWGRPGGGTVQISCQQ